MAQKLGIFVCTNKYLHYIVPFVDAAHRKGLDTQIFFTGQGVLLTQEERFKELVDKAKLYVCDVSFRANGLEGNEVPGVGFKQFVTQARNAEMIEEVDRYVVF
jgi:predicted peroxiredoxin